MPLVTICIQEPSSGVAQILVMELVNGVNYVKLRHFLTAISPRKTSVPLTKSNLNALLQLAQSDRERELIWCTAYQASGLSHAATKYLGTGLQNMVQRMARVEESL